MSRYPENIDTSADLPQVSDNITEIAGESINSMREAIFAIESAIGKNPQGTAASLVSRLEQSINTDGTIKASALLAAGLIALPISNSQIASNAGIAESKLDLDVATQTLQNEISSNDTDIAALQGIFNALINNFAQHVGGTAFKHDAFAILLDVLFPTSTPPDYYPLTATNVGDALIQINDNFQDHISVSKVGAHQASNISVNNTFTNIIAADVQTALERLDDTQDVILVRHRDDQHANGFDNWANQADGYTITSQLLPSTLGAQASATIISGSRNVIDFGSLTLSDFPIKQGDVVVINDTSAAGNYVINDIGPRNPVGQKAALTAFQLEVVGTIAIDGAINAQIFSKSSISQLKTNVAATIYQIDTLADSIQLARPNSAKVLSLGINPRFITSADTLALEAGVGGTNTRTITVNNLHYDRTNAPAATVSIDTIVERINYVFQNRVDGNAFPAAAYRVGDELLLSHNWDTDVNYSLKILSAGTGNFTLGLDGYGADAVDRYARPTSDAAFYVAGVRITRPDNILATTASVAGQVITLPVNPIQAGVKIGHLVQVISHPTDVSALGTYYIIAASSNSITVHKTAGITAASAIQVEIFHDAIPLDDLRGDVKSNVVETFLDRSGRANYNQRAEYTNISNIKIIDVSDNFQPTTTILTSAISGSELSFKLTIAGTDGTVVRVPSTFKGNLKVYSPINIEYIIINVVATAGTGTSTITVFEHIDEEEVLEICSVNLDGIHTAANIVDKRLFGSIGLDEIREDYTQANIETPLIDLRSNGIVYGFDILEDNYQDLSVFDSDAFGVLLKGGVSYVAGSRSQVATIPVMFPSAAGTFYVAVNAIGNFEIINGADFSLEQILDGYAGEFALTTKVVHSGSLSTPLTSTDLRFFINDLDSKLELVLDITNRRIGNLASVDAALAYINNYPFSEKFKLRVVSKTTDTITIPSGFRDITLVIDGNVGNIVLNSPCKIISESITDRSSPHVIGNITINSGCDAFDISGLNITGGMIITTVSGTIGQVSDCIVNSSISATGNGTLMVDKCVFSTNSTGITSTVKELYVNKTSFAGGTVSSAGSATSITRITGCRFSSTSGFGTYASTETIFNDCVFIGNTSGSMTLNTLANISNCIFTNIAQTAGGIIVVSAAQPVNINNCLFKSITLSGTGLIVSGTTSSSINIQSCIFNTITFTSNPAIIANKFHDNVLVSPVNSSLIRMAGNGSFVGNAGFHSVGSSTVGISSNRPILIQNNTFIGSGLGYNIDLAFTSSVGSRYSLVSGNFFDTINTYAIICGATTTGVIISNNYFNTASATAINLGAAAGDINISSNEFKCDVFITSSNPLDNLRIYDNIIDTGSTATLQVGSYFELSNNRITSGLTLQGTELLYSIISNNYMSSLTLGLPGNHLVIEGNTFDLLAVSFNILNSTVSGNYFIDITNDGSSRIFRNVVFASNVFTGSIQDSDNIIWENSVISNNIVEIAAITVQTPGTSRVAIENNRFKNIAMTITGAGATISDIVFNGNTDIQTLTLSKELTKSTMIGNKLSGTATLSGGTSNSIISNNEITGNSSEFIISVSCSRSVITGNRIGSALSVAAPTDSNIGENNCDLILVSTPTKSKIDNNKCIVNISVSGAIINTSVCSNVCRFISIEAAGTTNSDVIVSNNILDTNLEVITGVGAHQIVGTNITGNKIGGDIQIGISSTSNIDINGLNITGNTCGALQVVSTTGNVNLDNIIISANNAGISVCETVSAAKTAVITGLNINNNIASISIYPSIGAAGSATLSDCSIVNNMIGDIDIGTSITTGTLSVSDTNIFGNIDGDITIAALAATGGTISLVNISICENVNTTISFFTNITTGIPDLTFAAISINNNLVNGISVNDFPAARIIDRLAVNNNIVKTDASIVIGNTSGTSYFGIQKSIIANNLSKSSSTDLYVNVGSVSELNISNNIINELVLGSPSTVSFLNIIGNKILDNLDVSNIAGLVRSMILLGNIAAGSIILPPDTQFISGPSQSKFMLNHAADWVSSGITIATGGEKIFIFGNTALNPSTNFTYDGTGNLTFANTNTIEAGGGIAMT